MKIKDKRSTMSDGKFEICKDGKNANLFKQEFVGIRSEEF